MIPNIHDDVDMIVSCCQHVLDSLDFYDSDSDLCLDIISDLVIRLVSDVQDLGCYFEKFVFERSK